MRDQIEQLTEAIAGTIQPIGGAYVPVPDPEPEGDSLEEEGVTKVQLEKLVSAMVDAPKVQQVMERILKESGGSSPGLMDRASTFRSLLRSHLRHSVPLALTNAGLTVQSSLAGKARRGIKAIAQGKSMEDVEALWDQELAEDAEPQSDESLFEQLDGMLSDDDAG